MIWKNPFLSKNSEQQMGEDQFLTLFDCTALQMIETENLEKVSYVSSTAGAGKTSLFRAFSASVLSKIVSPESSDTYADIRREMTRLGTIKEDKVLLASAILSCARGYSIIDEMFQNGRRKQIFFALLNYRITIALLKSIGHILEMETEDYERIQFVQIPQEMTSDEAHFKNGKVLYDWACQGERKLCRYLDSERDEQIEVSFVHTTLLLLKLFEPGNILINGRPYFHNILIIFDDFHKLTDNQKEMIAEVVYTLKVNLGVWFGQRLEGVRDEHLISMDGSLNRDYNPNIVIDNYWPEKQSLFYKMLEQIADRRIKEAELEGYLKFSDCISDRLERKYTKEWDRFSESQKEKIDRDSEMGCRYRKIVSYICTQKDMQALDRAIWYECIAIQENRRQTGQMSLYLGEVMELSDFEAFVAKNRNSAKFYICNKMNIPFYYGLNNLKMLSSYNVEQFLFFAGAYFDCCRVKCMERKQKKIQSLNGEEQQKALLVAVKRKWEDMDYRYPNIKKIKDFLNRIADVCAESRDAERAAYAGGAFTGVGVDKEALLMCLDRPEYSDLIETLGACLSSKYLERREINDGKIIVFYLNRWLCVHYHLPLAYGGWARCSMERLMTFYRGSTDSNKNQMEFNLL